MNIASKKRIVLMCAYLVPAVYGAAGFATPAGAQNAVAPAVSQAASATDEELSKRVQAALHSDPYFYDEHVSVSVENGVVMLRGIVFSDWDVRDALRIASRAAPQSRVVDNLSIEQGGR